VQLISSLISIRLILTYLSLYVFPPPFIVDSDQEAQLLCQEFVPDNQQSYILLRASIRLYVFHLVADSYPYAALPASDLWVGYC